MKSLLVVFFVLFFSSAFSQKLQKIARLSESLEEISGLAFLNDTVLVAHNDSGNEPFLYFLNLKGQTIHKVLVSNVKNMDWEDITTDGKGYLYIGDIGNNGNNRKSLHIYKVSTKDILKKETVTAENIEFSYAEQTAFPPNETGLHFDAEALSYCRDSIYIFTKCRTKPFDGKSFCYAVPVKPGKYELKKHTELFLGKGGFFRDAVTGSAICEDKCYILTYNRMIVYKMKNGKFEFQKQIYLKPYSQKEAIATRDNKTVYISDERQKIIGGGNLYKIKME